MKYLTILPVILISTLYSSACTCVQYNSLCESFAEYLPQFHPHYPPIENNINERMICYVEYTGNRIMYNDYYGLYRYEVKVIDLIFGAIQPGEDGFHNTDSTFWLVSGATSCHDYFSFGEGDYALVAPHYNFFTESQYGFSICDDDFFIYSNPIEPAEYNNIVGNIEECLSHLCDDNLNLSETHEQPAVYKAGLITSTSYANANKVVYKANDRVSLQTGFRTNKDYDFRVVMDSCD